MNAIDNYYNGCYLQVGFLDKIRPEERNFADLREAFQFILKRNKEYAVLLWNGVPLRLSYVWDIPFMIEQIIIFLDKLVDTENQDIEPNHHCVFQTKNIKCDWYMEWNAEFLQINSQWEKIPGNYQSALNAIAQIKMMKTDFISEWKILLEQLIRAFQDSGAKLYDPDQVARFDMLIRINQVIERRGRYYRTNNGNDLGLMG